MTPGQHALDEAARQETARIYRATIPEHRRDHPPPDNDDDSATRQTTPKPTRSTTQPKPVTPPWAAHLTRAKTRHAHS